MTIDDAIRNAESDRQIYILLATYIESFQIGARCPEQPMNLPIIELDDVRMRFRQLIMDLDNASTHMNDKGLVIKDVLYVYDAALCRLQSLDEERKRLSDKRMPEHGMNQVFRAIPDTLSLRSIS